MGFLDSFKSWLRTETAEAQDLGRQTKGRMEAELDRREGELNLTPEQRLDQLQDKIADGDSTLDSLREKIEGREALADATGEVADLGRSADGTPLDNVLDLESEEVIPPEPPPSS
ncbi:MAG: hypothetical protein ACRBK7_21655 [Acidimicrobiales bacterium]